MRGRGCEPTTTIPADTPIYTTLRYDPIHSPFRLSALSLRQPTPRAASSQRTKLSVVVCPTIAFCTLTFRSLAPRILGKRLRHTRLLRQTHANVKLCPLITDCGYLTNRSKRADFPYLSKTRSESPAFVLSHLLLSSEYSKI